MKNIVIIVAGGKSERFGGGCPKQFLEVAGKPLLFYSLEAFQKSSRIDAIALVLPKGEVEANSHLKKTFSKLKWIVPGGEKRQDSTWNGFKAIPPCEVVLVHDAARPFVSPGTIDKVIDGAKKHGGACIAGAPAKDTIKEVDNGGVIKRTIERSKLWQVHTPQAFRYTILKEALKKAMGEKFYGTDEAMLVERLGKPVKVVDGGRTYLKVTVPEDMLVAKAILEMEKR